MLADAGLLERQGIEGGRPGAFVLSLTPAGRRVAMGEVRPELAMPASGPPAGRRTRRRGKSGAATAVTGDEADPGLLERLREWRTAEARRRQVPAYVIFPDRTLAALATARPRSPGELLAVHGVGAAKLEAYGAALLQLLA